MNATTGRQWQEEFGLAEHGGLFLATKADLKSAAPKASQAHVARRAFDLLKLDGVLCTDSAPLVYFKLVKRIDNAKIVTLHRTFWNHGGAPILALIAPNEVHIYSGFVRPAPGTESAQRIPAFVETLERASSGLKEFLPAVESGESSEGTRNHSILRTALVAIFSTTSRLPAASCSLCPQQRWMRPRLTPFCADSFCLLSIDRRVIGGSYLKRIGLPNADPPERRSYPAAKNEGQRVPL